jgi:serine/threonine protein kinase
MEQPQLGRYVIDSEIGRGAMGVVFKATDSVLQRTVAVKTVNMAMEKDHADKYEARFYQEARAAGGLNHPNIVTVYDAGKAGDVVYMAMEYIQGVELRSLLVEGQPMGVAQALSVAAQVAEGLDYAHRQGVVHRDIKPANIMVVADGPVKITVAKANSNPRSTRFRSLFSGSQSKRTNAIYVCIYAYAMRYLGRITPELSCKRINRRRGRSPRHSAARLTAPTYVRRRDRMASGRP